MAGKPNTLTRRHITFGVFVLVSAAELWKMAATVVAYSLEHESCFHIILIPVVVSAWLLFAERARIFSAVRSSIVPGP